MLGPLLSMYEKGAITGDHLVAQCIQMIDLDNPGLVLKELPNSLLDRLLEYAHRYQPGRMVSNYGMPPTTGQVDAAKRWIEDLRITREGGKASTEADWDRYRMEERIIDILKSFSVSGKSGPTSLTIYQIAIEYAKKCESDFHSMGRPLGGVGAGNRALTKYMAGQISQRVKAEKLERIELLFLHPANTESLVYNYSNQRIIAATATARYRIPMYRLRQAEHLLGPRSR